MLSNGEKMEYAKRAALAVLEQLGPARPRRRHRLRLAALRARPAAARRREPAPSSRPASSRSSTAAAPTSRRRSTSRAAISSSPARACATSFSSPTATPTAAPRTTRADRRAGARRDHRHHHPDRLRHHQPRPAERDLERDRRRVPPRRERARAAAADDPRHAAPARRQRRPQGAAPARIGDGGTILAGIAERELPPVDRWALTQPKRGAEVRLYVGARRAPRSAARDLAVRARPRRGDARSTSRPGPPPGRRGTASTSSGRSSSLWAAPHGLAGDRHLEVERRRDGTADPTRDARPTATGRSRSGCRRRATCCCAPPDAAPSPRPCRISGPASTRRCWSRPRARARSRGRSSSWCPPRSASGREARASGRIAALLAQLAALTGGAVDPDPAAIFAARPGVKRERTPLATYLVPLALGAGARRRRASPSRRRAL